MWTWLEPLKKSRLIFLSSLFCCFAPRVLFVHNQNHHMCNCLVIESLLSYYVFEICHVGVEKRILRMKELGRSVF